MRGLTDINSLLQLINALNEACQELEQAYIKKDMASLERLKSNILSLQSKIGYTIQ